MTEKTAISTSVSAVGRRKEAVAQVTLTKGTGQFFINEKPAQDYLQNQSSSLLSIKAPFEIFQTASLPADTTPIVNILEFDTFVKVQGGGLIGQAEAIQLGLARALCLISNSDESTKKSLKDKGYLTQDSREKERRKYGLKKARKASQYHKR
jgi:small subunit ribosomal protein S9